MLDLAPFDFIDPLDDRRTQQELQCQDREGENDRNYNRKVGVGDNTHTDRKQQSEQQR
jgi:hypothetical protein